jgi:hypothetical protein
VIKTLVVRNTKTYTIFNRNVSQRQENTRGISKPCAYDFDQDRRVYYEDSTSYNNRCPMDLRTKMRKIVPWPVDAMTSSVVPWP